MWSIDLGTPSSGWLGILPLFEGGRACWMRALYIWLEQRCNWGSQVQRGELRGLGLDGWGLQYMLPSRSGRRSV